jgi:hypothetical protein
VRLDHLPILSRWSGVLLVAFACSLGHSTYLQASAFRVASGKCELVSNGCEVKIEGSGLSRSELDKQAPPALKDTGQVEPRMTFEIEPRKTSDGPAGTRTWFFLAKISGGLSVPTQDRKIEFTWGAMQPVTLTLTLAATDSRDASQIKWSLEPPSTPWNLAQDRWTEFTVTRSDQALISIVLKHSTYLDGRVGHGSRIPLDRFYLCSERAADVSNCSKSKALQGSISTFWLAIDPQFDQYGTYSGNLEIDTEPHSDIKSISPTINQTDRCAQAIGFLLILAGVTAAWLILTFGKGLYSRNQALLPAVQLRERAASLVLDLDKIPEPLKESTTAANHKLAGILGHLAELYLDEQQFLPPRVPSSFGTTSVQASAYQSFLQNQSQLIDNLEMIVSQGIVPAAQKWSDKISPGDLALLKTLIGQLSDLANTIPQPPNSLQTNISNLLANWHPTTVTAQTAKAAVAMTIASPRRKEKTSFRILLQLEAITYVFWIVWALLTSLAGLLVLILPNPGFGGGIDYVQCLLWGFGLPVAGQSLQQLSVSSINTQLGITLTKP